MKLITSKGTLYLLGFIVGITLIQATVLKNLENQNCENSCQGN